MEYMDQEIVSDGYFTEINVQYIQPVLDGQGITATPYQTSSPSPHPVVIADESPFIGFRIEPEYDESVKLECLSSVALEGSRRTGIYPVSALLG